MAKKKYYAVIIGKVPGIYSTWDQCKEQTNGVPGAQYKSFSTLTEAEQYIREASEGSSIVAQDVVEVASESLNTQVEHKIAILTIDEVIAFVDGSYDVTEEKSAFGAIIFSYGGNKDILYKAFTKQLGEEFISLRNVAAELEGVKEAISWAIKYSKRKITIYYDYEGIEKWATGQWKANKVITKNYVRFIQEKRNILEIEFVKVPAHSGVKFNEEVDAVAKNALLAKGHKTYNDGSVYFVGYGVEDWETIVQCINEENIRLVEAEISPISIGVEKIGTRDKIKVTQANNTVVINCYKNSKSYVQGKQTVLFQKIIAAAIEMLGSKQSVIETLNSFHALTLRSDEVENKFEQLLPHYKHTTEKHYLNLLSAVYNTMLTGYMPDYTCLVTPIFRAYEYYLHRILGDVMQLDTETDKGTNNFAFFLKNAVGLYECNSKNSNLLSLPQLNYLNSLYTQYNSVRHPYSHWSASDIDTAVITDIDTARQLLLDGLNLIDQYYTLF
jgi:ribonuclease HI